MKATPGNWLVVESPHLGTIRRRGLIVEVHGPDGTAPFLVRWTDNDQESLFFPGPDAHVELENGQADPGRRAPVEPASAPSPADPARP